MSSPTTRFLDVGEGRIGYDVTGDDASPLAVCIPGMGDLRSGFRFLVPQLVAAGYRVATMDLRGHGDSDATFSSYDDVAAGGDALALVGHLGGPAVLIGSSMGAGAAAWAAAERPGAVRAVVLSGPFVRDVPAPFVMRAAFRAMLVRPWGRWAWLTYLKTLFPGAPPADLADHLARIRTALDRPGHWTAFVKTTRTSHAPVAARLDDVIAPSLVVMGERDPDFPDPAAEARAVSARLGGRTLLIPDTGHYPHAERPDVVGPAVVGFLHEVAAGA